MAQPNRNTAARPEKVVDRLLEFTLKNRRNMAALGVKEADVSRESKTTGWAVESRG